MDRARQASAAPYPFSHINIFSPCNPHEHSSCLQGGICFPQVVHLPSQDPEGEKHPAKQNFQAERGEMGGRSWNELAAEDEDRSAG